MTGQYVPYCYWNWRNDGNVRKAIAIFLGPASTFIWAGAVLAAGYWSGSELILDATAVFAFAVAALAFINLLPIKTAGRPTDGYYLFHLDSFPEHPTRPDPDSTGPESLPEVTAEVEHDEDSRSAQQR